MKSRIFTSILLFVLIFNLIAPVSVYAKKDNSNSKKNKLESTSVNKGQSKKLETTVVPSPGVLGSTSEIYDFIVESLDLIDSVNVNEQLRSKIVIKNTSNFDWSKQDVKISYHWVDENGEYEVFRGDDTSLLSNVAQNKTTREGQSIKIKAPSIPGNFKLRVDLIKNNTWFTNKTSYRFEKEFEVKGDLDIASYESEMILNDGDEFANDENLKATVTPYTRQPGSENAGFIYSYVQFTESPVEDILNGTAQWSKWKLLPDPWNSSDVHFTIKDTSVGVKETYMRYRAIKKLTNATPESYGSAIMNIGRAEKTSDIYYVDDIFFDNVPPIGELTINNGASSTTSRTGSLQITASDTVDGIEGSGLNGMRLTNNCDVNDLESNNWSEWEAELTDKDNYDLGTGSVMTVCVQVTDKAGNVATFVDDIIFRLPYVPPVLGDYSGYLQPGNNTYVDVFGNRYVDKLAGTAEHPFGFKSAYELDDPIINIYSELKNGERVSTITYVKLPPPEITYIDFNEDKTKAKIYGIAMQKYDYTEFIIDYEVLKDGCTVTIFNDCIEQKYANVEGNLEHVGLSLYEKMPWWYIWGDPEIGWTWNDVETGEWIIEIDINDANEIGDLIYARSQSWGTLDTGIEELGTIDFLETDKLISGYSNIEKLEDTDRLSLIQYIENNWGIKLSEEDSKWEEGYLVKLVEALEIVPDWMFKGYLTEIIRDDKNDEKPEARGFTDDSKAGTVMEIYNKNSLLDLEWLYVHELMHVYQFKYGGQRNNAHTNPYEGSTIYNYYTTFGFEKLSTPFDTGNGLQYYEYSWGKGVEDWKNFVSNYAVERAYKSIPHEEMAETLTFYLIDQEQFYTFDETVDKLGTTQATLYDIYDGDPKDSEILLEKLEFVQNNIFN